MNIARKSVQQSVPSLFRITALQLSPNRLPEHAKFAESSEVSPCDKTAPILPSRRQQPIHILREPCELSTSCKACQRPLSSSTGPFRSRSDGRIDGPCKFYLPGPLVVVWGLRIRGMSLSQYCSRYPYPPTPLPPPLLRGRRRLLLTTTPLRL